MWDKPEVPFESKLVRGHRQTRVKAVVNLYPCFGDERSIEKFVKEAKSYGREIYVRNVGDRRLRDMKKLAEARSPRVKRGEKLEFIAEGVDDSATRIALRLYSGVVSEHCDRLRFDRFYHWTETYGIKLFEPRVSRINGQTHLEAIVTGNYGFGSESCMTEFAEEAQKYERGIYVIEQRCHELCDLKSIMAAMMSGGAVPGGKVEFVVDGTDEEAERIALRLYSGVTSEYSPNFDRFEKGFPWSYDGGFMDWEWENLIKLRPSNAV